MGKRIEEAGLVAAAAGLVLFRYGNYWSESWHTKYCLLMALGCLGFSYAIARQLSWKFFPILATALLSGIWVGCFLFNQYIIDRDIGYREALAHDALYGVLCVVLGALFIARFPLRLVGALKKILLTFFSLSVVYTYWEWACWPDQVMQRGAFSGNPSMNGCLIACLLPFALDLCQTKFQRWGLVTITLGAVTAVFASIPLGCLAVALFVYSSGGLSQKSRKALWGALATGGLLCIAGYGLQGKVFFDSDGRFEYWRNFFQDWLHGIPGPIGYRIPISLWWGTGLGTSLHVGSELQLLHSTPAQALQGQDLFMWYHNEYLQTLFELGFVGLVALLLAWHELYRRAGSHRTYLASFLAWSGAALFNYPFRLPLHAMSLVVLATLILRDTGPSASSERVQ